MGQIPQLCYRKRELVGFMVTYWVEYWQREHFNLNRKKLKIEWKQPLKGNVEQKNTIKSEQDDIF